MEAVNGRGGSETPEAVGAGIPGAVGAGKPKGQPFFPVAVGAGRSHFLDATLAVDAGSLTRKARRSRTMMMKMMRSIEVPEEAGKEVATQLERLAPSLKIGAMVVETSRLPLGHGNGRRCKKDGKPHGAQHMPKTNRGWRPIKIKEEKVYVPFL